VLEKITQLEGVVMTIHIGAKVGEIAETVLMPGDPMRAKYMAEKLLTDVNCYSEVRGMYGFTGTYKGKKVSIQGSGMGIPSIGIYANELISSYNVKNLIRIGSCGSIQEKVKLWDIVIAQGACTDSAINDIPFRGMSYAPISSFELLYKAYEAAKAKGVNYHVGNIISSDIFYDDFDLWKTWARYNVLAIEMEAAKLFTLGAKFGVNTLAICTVSDHLITKEECNAEERESAFDQMVEIALDIA
jgi:purine-nucleoside phosphorylase